jgi:hypothetical protein
MAAILQAVLDGLFGIRQHIVTSLAYLTLRLYGKEVVYSDVKAGTFASRTPSPLSLESAKDIDTLLNMSKDSVANAEQRRGVVTDKCKTLLTLGSLLLGVVGLLLPKYLAFDSVWMRWLSVIAIAILFNAIIILLMFFDVGQDMIVSLGQDDIPLDDTNLKKSLLNRCLQCCAATENRTDYLVELYRSARFCLLSALTIIAGLVLTSLLMSSPSDQTERIVREMRSDPPLTNLLRGPKGDTGQKGDRGDRGATGFKGENGDKGDRGSDANEDDIVTRLLSDSRLRDAIEKTASKHSKNTAQP